jgi:enamine deaminase RidA (YjgF/YER057c/UK114 family)
MIQTIDVGTKYPGVSLATLAPAKELLFLTGHCPTDKDGNAIEGDFEKQVTVTFENLRTTLQAAGLTFDSVVKLNVYLTKVDPEILATFKKVRNTFVNLEAPPAFTVIGIGALWDPKLMIEIDGIAVATSQT